MPESTIVNSTVFSPGFNFKYGSAANLDALEYEKGSIIFCTNGQHFVDISDNRVRISDIHIDIPEYQLTSYSGPATYTEGNTNYTGAESTESTSSTSFTPEPLPAIYIASDTHRVYFYSTSTQSMQRLSVYAADAATNDGAGNNIVDTYCTKTTESTDYQDTSDKITALQEAISSLPTFIIRICEDSLPETGEEGVLYFVPDTKEGSTTESYATYIWIKDDSYYLNVGTSSAKLSDYATKTYTDTQISTAKSDLTTAINAGDKTQADNLTALTTRVTAVESTASANATNIATNTSNINSNTDKINTNTSSIADLNTALANDEVKINTLETNVSTVTTQADTNKEDIASLSARLNAAETNINSMSGGDTSGSSLSSIGARLTADEINIQKNKTNIESTKSDLATTKTQVATNVSNISSINSDISTMKTNITNLQNTTSSNTSSIETNTTNISTNTTNIATNAGDIATLKSRLSTDETTLKNIYVTGSATNIDFNTYNKHGCFYISSMTSATNGPSTTDAGTLIIHTSGITIVQIYMTTSNIFARHYINSKWGSWVCISSWNPSETNGTNVTDEYGTSTEYSATT